MTSRYVLFSLATSLILLLRNIALLTVSTDPYCLLGVPSLLHEKASSSSSSPLSLRAGIVTTATTIDRNQSSDIKKDVAGNDYNDNAVVYHQDTFYTPSHNWTTYRYPARFASRQGDNSNKSSSHNLSFLIDERQQHQPKRQAILVGVLSVAHERAPRDWIRQTWAYQRSNVFFLLAGPWTTDLHNEFVQYQDLIWMDAPEAYRAITRKVQCWYAALQQHVPPDMYHYAMKTDDDSYVRLESLEKEIWAMMQVRNNNQSNALLYWGAPCTRGRVIRDPQHKWHVDVDTYAADKYPRYASGAGYLIHSSLVACMVREMQEKLNDRTSAAVSSSSFYLPNEDAYTGVLVDRCQGTCVRDERFPSHQQKYRPPRNSQDNSDHDAPNNKDTKNIGWLVQHHIKTAVDMERLHQMMSR